MTDKVSHVRYEFDALMRAQRYWTKAKLSGDEDLEYIACESFLVHYRNLIDFLTGHRGKADDILPKHLKVGPSYIFPDAIELKDAINKRLSHLTDMRTTSQAEWDAGSLLRRLSLPWSAFVRDMAARGTAMPELPPDTPLSDVVVTNTSGSLPIEEQATVRTMRYD